MGVAQQPQPQPQAAPQPPTSANILIHKKEQRFLLLESVIDCTRLDELQAQMMELQGYGNRVAVSSAYIVFDECWKVTNSVTQLPDGAMPEYEEQPNS